MRIEIEAHTLVLYIIAIDIAYHPFLIIFIIDRKTISSTRRLCAS